MTNNEKKIMYVTKRREENREHYNEMQRGYSKSYYEVNKEERKKINLERYYEKKYKPDKYLLDQEMKTFRKILL